MRLSIVYSLLGRIFLYEPCSQRSALSLGFTGNDRPCRHQTHRHTIRAPEPVNLRRRKLLIVVACSLFFHCEISERYPALNSAQIPTPGPTMSRFDHMHPLTHPAGQFDSGIIAACDHLMGSFDRKVIGNPPLAPIRRLRPKPAMTIPDIGSAAQTDDIVPPQADGIIITRDMRDQNGSGGTSARVRIRHIMAAADRADGQKSL